MHMALFKRKNPLHCLVIKLGRQPLNNNNISTRMHSELKLSIFEQIGPEHNNVEYRILR